MARARLIRGVVLGLLLAGAPGVRAQSQVTQEEIRTWERKARETREDVKSLGDRLEKERKKILEARSEELEVLDTIERIERRMADAEDARFEAEEDLQRLQTRQAQSGERLGELQLEYAAAQRRAGARLRAIYTQHGHGLLRVVLSSDSLGQIQRRAYLLSRLARRDVEILLEMQSLERQLSQQQDRLLKLEHEAGLQKERLEFQVEQLSSERSMHRRFLARVQGNRRLHEKAARELEAQQAELETLLSELESDPGGLGPPLAAFKGELPWPLEGRVVGTFGRRKNPRFDTFTQHSGIDLSVRLGEKVRAVARGLVRFTDRFKGYGNLAIIQHAGNYYSLYGHLDGFLVTPGEIVAGGQELGTAGQTGSLEGPVLYFELRRGRVPIDPLDWLASRRR